MAQPNDLLALFYDEAEELLVALDAGLRDLAAGRADGDRINAVFRAVHSIKGGAAAFGLAAVVAYAHDFETILDDLRAGRRGADAGLLADLLAASDHLADLVAAERGGSALPADRVAQARAALAALLPQAAPAGFVFEPLPLAALPALGPQRFDIRFAPHAAVFAAGHDPGLILRDLAALGQAQITLDRSRLPAAAEFDPAQCYLAWQVTLETDADGSTIAALFDFVEGLCDLAITPAAADADAAPPPVAAPPPPRPTIRVDVERVDRLVDVAGELVIHQAMLAEAISTALTPAGSEVDRNLDLLRQLSRQIQDSVMAIRAQPVKPLFDRMHRILREAAASTGKSATLTTEGEGTEVDRTIIERLADPLTHMIRNAVDHGIEPAPIRAARGKPAMGAVTLAAAHRSGRIVITLSDDGGGIDRDRVRGIAVERGLIAASADLTPAEIDALLFLPGFSTAPTVSALSGRGVGMDVVRAEIAALGGRVAITSTPGQGTTLTISLPLTLAVLDGMVVTAAAQTLVLPVASIIETLRLDPATCHPLGLSDPLIEVRGRCLPMVDVGQSLGFRAPNGGDPPSIAVIVERDEQSAMALLVDTIRDQRQVVIKGLEANYGHIPGIAAATVLGDGSVALILDPTELLPPDPLLPSPPNRFSMQKDMSKDIGEFVVFRAIGQDFAIDILSVREIRGWSRPASLPRAPGDVRGVINLRGAIIPIVDFAMRLGLAETAEDDRNVIIVTALNGRVTGLLVETVTDILGLPMADIQPPPDLVPDATRAMLRGIVPLDGRLIRILEVATLLAPDLDGIAA